MNILVIGGVEIKRYYTMAIDALYEIARAHYWSGQLGNARQFIQTALRLSEVSVGEKELQGRLKLLLLYGQVLIVDSLLARKDNAQITIETLEQAQQMAETIQDVQGHANALSLLGQAHYFTVLGTNLRRNGSPDSPEEEGQYDTAMTYHRQALKVRETLHDTRGMSESLFQIGSIYERWQQYDTSREYYTKAQELAVKGEHVFEQAEPARHFALHALLGGKLDQALTLALEALAFREDSGFKPYLPLDHLLLRDIYLAKGDMSNAEMHTERASVLAEEMGYPTFVSSAANLRDMQKGK